MAEDQDQDPNLADQPPSSLDQDRANFAQRVHQGLDQYLGGVRNLAPKSNEQAAEMALDATPIVGNVRSAQAGYDAYNKGDWLGAALGAIGAVPVLGGIIAGPAARTANHEALALAKEMHAVGHTPEAIHKETGWWQGPDSKWRFEIPDNEAKLADTNTRGKYTEVKGISHPELEKAYEMPANIKGGYGASYPEAQGWYNPPTKSIGVYGPDEEALRSTLLHELQHHVQHAEGFPPGGNPRHIAPEAIAAERSRLLAVPEGKGWTSVGTHSGDVTDEQIAHRLYRQLPGEKEAQKVQERMHMTPDERRNLPPFPYKAGGSVSDKTYALLHKLKRQDGGPVDAPTQSPPSAADIPTIDPAPLIPKSVSDMMPKPNLNQNVTGTPTYGGTINPFESKFVEDWEPLVYGIPYLGAAKMAEQLPQVARTLERTEEGMRAPGALQGIYDKISNLPSNASDIVSNTWNNGLPSSSARVEAAYEGMRTKNDELYKLDPVGYLQEVLAHAMHEPTGPGEAIAKDEYMRGVPMPVRDKVYRYILQVKGGPQAFETTTSPSSTKQPDRLTPGGFETQVVPTAPAQARGGAVSDKTNALLAKLKKRA